MKRKRHLAKRFASATALAVSAATASTPSVFAHHGLGWGADDTQMEYWRTPSLLGGNAYNGAQWGANNLDLYTNLNMIETETWTDIKAYIDSDLGYPLIGVAGCVSFWSSSNCDREIASWALWTADGGDPELSTTEWKYAGCHEMGHTGGIGERWDLVSCMHGQKPSPLESRHGFLSTTEPNSDAGEINYWIN